MGRHLLVKKRLFVQKLVVVFAVADVWPFFFQAFGPILTGKLAHFGVELSI